MDDGVISTTGAGLVGGVNFLDRLMSPPQYLKHTGGPIAIGQALADNSVLWQNVLQIIQSAGPNTQEVGGASAGSSRLAVVSSPPLRTVVEMTGVLETGTRLDIPFQVGSAGQLQAMVDCDSCVMSLVAPDGMVLSSTAVSRDTISGTIGVRSAYHRALVDPVAAGGWRMVLDAANDGAWHNYRLAISQPGEPEPIATLSSVRVNPGDAVTVTAIDPSIATGLGTAWYATIESSGTPILEVSLTDNGLDGDAQSGDGIFTVVLTAPTGPGVYEVRLRETSVNGSSAVVSRAFEVLRRGDLWVDSSTMGVQVITLVGGDSVHVAVPVVNNSPFALDDVRVEMWQKDHELADSVAISLAPWARDTVTMHWRVDGAGPVEATVMATSSGLDEDESPLNNAIGFTYSQGTLGAPLTGEAAFTVRVLPNPAQGSAWLAFGGMSGRDLRIDVFDVAGRKVWHKTLSARDQSKARVRLFGDSQSIAPGIYLVRVSSGTQLIVRRVAMLK
jgi:hypothetical protein